MKKKGFTLIELLAVIVILAIIALIAVPVILNIIDKANKSAFKDTAYGLISAGELYFAEQQLTLNGMDENKTFNLSEANTEGGLQIKGEVPIGKVSVTKEGKVAISVYNERYYAKKDYDDTEVEVYEVKYYSTLSGAVSDVNDGKAGANSDATKDNATAAVFKDNEGNVSVILLKDTTETSKITLSADMMVNLNGYALTFENSFLGFDGAKDQNNTITIDGRVSGSTMVLNGIDGGGRLIQTRTNKFIINGGNYIIQETLFNEEYGAVTINVSKGGQAIISDSIIIASAVGNSYGINARELTTTTISNSVIEASSTENKAHGITNLGTAYISNSDIKGYANYTYGEDEHYGSLSQGILNGVGGTLTINNSYVMGTHSGIQNNGTLYIDGGTYESVGHGGIYFSGIGTTSYVSNATLRECDMPEGYIQTSNSNKAGFYIGGSSESNDIKVYMDNCDVYGSWQPIVLTGSQNEKNNILYISNSKITTYNKIRIDNDTHKLYIGAGNNFKADNTNRPSAVVSTTDIYTRENFEN